MKSGGGGKGGSSSSGNEGVASLSESGKSKKDSNASMKSASAEATTTEAQTQTSDAGDSSIPLERRRGNARPPVSTDVSSRSMAVDVNVSVASEVGLVEQSPRSDSAAAKSKLEGGGTSLEVSPSATAAASATATASATQSASASASESSSTDPQSNAFVQLAKAWEKYMDDTPQVDPFETLKKLQNLHLFGPKGAQSTIDGQQQQQQAPLLDPNNPSSYYYGYMMPGMMGQHPLAPPALQHTRSSPLQRATSVLEQHYGDAAQSGGDGTDASGNGNGVMPPPIPLDPYQRSSSTPSAFRTRSVNSAFGTVPHTHVGSGLTQASAIDSIRGTAEEAYYADHDDLRYSAFDPVKYYARALEVQEDMERTSIEVMDTSNNTDATLSTNNKSSSSKKKKAQVVEKDTTATADVTSSSSTKKFIKRGAGSRAERFLSNVRVLRRRRRGRSGRENPAQPASVASSSNSSSSAAQQNGEASSTCSSGGTMSATEKTPPREKSTAAAAGTRSATVAVTSAPAAAQAAAPSPSPSTESTPMDTTVTVVTEADFADFSHNDTSMLSQSSEVSAIIKGAVKQDGSVSFNSSSSSSRQRSQDSSKDSNSIAPQSAASTNYQQLDSDADEEDAIRYQKITESPVPSPSPSYQMIADDRRSSSKSSSKSSIRIELASGKKKPLTTPSSANNNKNLVASPSPTSMSCGNSDQDPNTPPQGTPPSPQDSFTASPQTARSSNTGSSSSGHTTQAASTISSGNPSVLSTISETDREVMAANQEAKRRRGLRDLPALHKNDAAEPTEESIHSSSSNSNSTNPHRYLALQNSSSPDPLREGANLPLDRFFKDNEGSSRKESTAIVGVGAPNRAISGLTSSQHNSSVPAQGSQSSRSQSTTTPCSRPSGRTGSPATLGSSAYSVAHTNSSSSSGAQEEPPTFVSYMDRRGTSDLTSLREETESSSKRAGLANNEEREGSPIDLNAGYQEVVFQEAQPKPLRPDRRGRLDRFRGTRPPRSPVKGARPSTTTPPPRGMSPVCIHSALSPPRDIVDHPNSNISKPYVMRTIGPYGNKRFVMVDHHGAGAGAEHDATDMAATAANLVGAISTTSTGGESMIGVTYAESSIEVLQASSASDSTAAQEERQIMTSNVNLVTPEK